MLDRPKIEKFLPSDGVRDEALDQVRSELSSLDIGRVTVANIWDRTIIDKFDLGGSYPARILVMDHGISRKVKSLGWTPVVMFVAEEAYRELDNRGNL